MITTTYPWQDKETPVLPGEEWKAHPTNGFEFSTLGRMRNPRTGGLLGHLAVRGPGAGRRRSVPNKPYVSARTWVSGQRATLYAHSGVLETFVGPRPDNHDADHINHDRLDNRISNLRWRPAPENRADNRP